ncbi:hypothetical protein I7I51_02842 [Histoplasma capsulatum]|uniref:DUF7924 domain-containing protein n=1 Tax=Ajellomyces capsulatus TaxID=5037 RepID=A0A8A1MPT9_AJECA|nr:hypothetical protein I7I51_02842 [Histoplasma capsulatum]
MTLDADEPDYSVGFRREAFTDGQLQRLQPFVGDLTDTSYFMATFYMYFPFLTCEVKCGAAALDIADRQNAHSTTIAARATVELFKLMKRKKEIDREILTFSVSHDHTAVRIYAHYAVLEGEKTNFYRHPIHKFDFTALDGKENGRRTNSREIRNFNTPNNLTPNRCLQSRMMTASQVSAILPRQVLRQLPPLRNKHRYSKGQERSNITTVPNSVSSAEYPVNFYTTIGITEYLIKMGCEKFPQLRIHGDKNPNLAPIVRASRMAVNSSSPPDYDRCRSAKIGHTRVDG